MKITVVYYSKTGNTRTIAETIAGVLSCESVPVNLAKHGRKTKQETGLDKELFRNAVDKCNRADLVFIGTPVEFRKPHRRISELISNADIKKAALFCTCYGMPGAVFFDLESILLQKNIPLLNKLTLIVGTEKYRFSRDISQYRERVTGEHIKCARDFALDTVNISKPQDLRLRGVCGADCRLCVNYNKSCRGAGFSCWSGRGCGIFNCCVIKNSFRSCDKCNKSHSCTLLNTKGINL